MMEQTKMLFLFAVILGVIGASNCAPIEDELAFEQFLNGVGNQNLATAVEQWLGDMIWGSFKDGIRKVGSSFCNRLKNMPRETELVFIESVDNQLQAMQEEEDSEDVVTMQLFQGIRDWFQKNGRNLFQNIGKQICKTLPKTSEDALLVESQFDSDSNTDEVALQGRRRSNGFFKGLGNAARDIVRGKLCSANTQEQEEALVQYIDNQLEMMQDAEEQDSEVQSFWKKIRKYWKKTKNYIKPIIKRHFCASIEAMDEDDQIQDQVLQSVLQTWLDVIQK